MPTLPVNYSGELELDFAPIGVSLGRIELASGELKLRFHAVRLTYERHAAFAPFAVALALQSQDFDREEKMEFFPFGIFIQPQRVDLIL